jgi:flagellar hook-associated protein 3 FlgL
MTDSKSALDQLQRLAASQKKYIYSSDNPGAASASLTLNSSITVNEGYISNAQTTDSWMTAVEDAMKSVVTATNNAVSLVQTGLNDTMGADERKNDLAVQLSGIIDSVLQLSNSSYMDQYVFSGNQVFTKPFSVNATNPDQIDFSGDSGVITRDLGPGQSITVNLDGKQTFSALFSALISARTALTNNDTSALATSMTDIKNAQNTIIEARSLNGARMKQVDTAVATTKSTNSELKSLLSEKEDVNMAEVASLLENQTLTYQAVLEVGQRAISSLNLFSYLS